MDLGSPAALISQGWERVTTGASGAVVVRSPDGARHAKFVAVEYEGVLAGERDRLEWAAGRGLPTAPVLDWATGDQWAGLLTGTVAGIAAGQLPAAALWQAWPSITTALRRLHEVPAADCPFVRGLSEMFAAADEVVGRGAVNAQFLPVELRQTPPAEVLTHLRGELERRKAEEHADLVVCHGDLCLANVMVDPGTHVVTGLIDLGRLGRADRYADIALLLGNSRGTWTDEAQANAADDFFAAGYGITLSSDRRRFYLCLDALTWPTA